jgi:peptidoglycan-associated lipoprotein
MTKSPFVLLLAIAAVSALPSVASAQPAPVQQDRPRPELALGYSYAHSNAPPGGCGCFSLNGGSATFAWPIGSGRFAFAGDVNVVHAGDISSESKSLTLSTFTVGGRYMPHFGHSAWQPFSQVLVGAVHSSGSAVDGANPGSSNAGAAFAANIGGGLDYKFNSKFSIRLVEADYLVTTVDNSGNNHQNNIRIGAGLVIHFGKQRATQ